MENLLSLPVTWILGAITVLGGVIGKLSHLLWKTVNQRIAAQDKTLAAQGKIISSLQEDVKRMSKGCGAGGCFWAKRKGGE